MKKSFFIFVLFFQSQITSAETIQLTDQSVIQAKIIERTDKDITVNIDGVKMSYLLAEITSIDGQPMVSVSDGDISRLLKARQYPETAWPGIERELKTFLVDIDFSVLKTQAGQARENPEELRRCVAQLGRLIKRQGCLNFRNPHPLIKILVSSLVDVNNLREEEKREIFACSAISQLVSIILELLGVDAKIIIAPGHVFNAIALNERQVLFADFSNQVFGTVDVEKFYRIEGKYRVLKEKQRFTSKYFYIYIAGDTAATAIIYTNRGNYYEFEGDFNKALADYTKALEINANIAGVYCNRGLVFADKGDIARAIADYNKALEINPNDENAYNNRGLAFKNKGDFPRAIADFNKALEIDPKSAPIYDNLGNAYSVQGNYTQGIFYYTKAVETDPHYNKAWGDLHKAQALNSK